MRQEMDKDLRFRTNIDSRLLSTTELVLVHVPAQLDHKVSTAKSALIYRELCIGSHNIL